MDLWSELLEKQEELDKAIKDLREAGRNYAEADTAYRRMVAKETLRLKAKGMAVGLIEKVVFDDEQVLDALFQRDYTDTLVTASKEQINSLKLKIKTISEQLAREYGR